ncbi:DEAD/DEAH box helicase [Ruegeria arenilitoris]|uniref:Primosome assembly protein PriA n=1 Tax=Ruegeria arenilitoris TaxID=1173585 RepID=A0A238JV14_9RHOB|nr:DEAD/DEAH box helicase family protein [Ruegeria arenilitoris]SMX34491.1 primosome assembly protein PriA [Ruegeria arenilitoris]
MKLKELISDKRSSISGQGIDKTAYSQTLRHLQSYSFWEGSEDKPRLWEHQKAAIATIVAYLHGDKQIPERPEQTEAALLKLPTGTGKSGIIAILARCLPKVRRVLVLTPRTALTEQLLADIRYRFWSHLGYDVNGSTLFTAEADVFGTTLENVYVEQFLPKNVGMVMQHLGDRATDRAILVGTHQALGGIRKTAHDPDNVGSEVAAALLAHIRDQFDLVIVDEGHYEPAISWSRGVREFNLPTLLLSATPYRNDYKSFRVRGRYLFNFPYRQAVEERIIRPADIIAPEGDAELIAREAAIPQFVGIMHRELTERLREAERWFLNGDAPKVMVRGDDLETLTLLQTEINRVFDTQAVVIHDRAKKTKQNGDMFTCVASALRSRPDAQFWIHQNKLMEGIDDPSFVAVAIFDLMGNARQLVQQIGRATRYSRGEDGATQRGWILSTPANAERIRTTWQRYQGYEEYAARNTAHIVTNEVTLPDRLLEYMAEYQYINGEFRGRFEFEHPLAAGDIQIPRTAAVLRTAAPLPDIRVFATMIEEAIMDRDRFKITPIKDMPDGSLGFSYYAWRNSPYLIDRFFSEWKLGIFLAVQQGELVFMHDTEGLVVDMEDLSLKRVGRSVMEKAFPEDDDKSSRLSRMSFSSLDMSQHAIRAMALRTRSFADAFTDLLDPSLVPATAAGFVNGTARYVGFNRSRLRDATERYVSVADYVTWTTEIAAELADANRKRSHVFDRYAALVEDIDDEEAQPVSILLDPSLDDMRDDEAGGAAWALLEDIDYFDLCAEVDGETGEFVIQIGDEEVPCSVEFISETRKYRIASTKLDELAPAPEGDDRRQALTLVQRLNKGQAFRILTQRDGVVYSEGSFYEPKLQWVQDGETKPVLEYIHACATLDAVVSEKGDNEYADNKENWYKQSIFGIFSSVCEGLLADNGIEEDKLTAAIEAIPVWLCDDDAREAADFIGFDPENRKIVLVHAKVGNVGQGGTGYHVGGLQDVGRQALASLGFISRGQPSTVWTPERWQTDVQANQVTLNGRSRIFRNPEDLTAVQLNDLLHACCRNPSFDREIWIVGAKMARRQALVDGLDRQPWPNRLRQFLMHWDAMQTACARANTRLRFYCSS